MVVKKTKSVLQGDIVFTNFSPQMGHEQAGRRPAVVISNNTFNEKTGLAVVCPITSREVCSPLHVRLSGNTQTQGTILCDQIKTLDLGARGFDVIESIPFDILDEVVEIVLAMIEIY